MFNFFYHYVYQDVYQPVWPNIVASIIVGAWVIWRNRLHIEKIEHRMKDHITGELHAHLSRLHPAELHSSGSSNPDSSLPSQQEAE